MNLNEHLGGFDINGNIVADRTSADLEALHIAYETGRANTGGDGLGSIPIIDFRPYLDSVPDLHDELRSLVSRARLFAANGHADNQVFLGSSAEASAPQSHYELTKGCEEGFWGRAYRTTRKDLQSLFVIWSGVN
jgi:hypothetical protein